MTRRLREMLGDIEDMLMEPGEGRDLATILSALRGPDASGAYEGRPDGDVVRIKMHTTAAIRAAAFPRLAKVGYASSLVHTDTGKDVWLFEDPNQFYSPSQDEAAIVGRHFTQHVKDAATVLELRHRSRYDVPSPRYSYVMPSYLGTISSDDVTQAPQQVVHQPCPSWDPARVDGDFGDPRD